LEPLSAMIGLVVHFLWAAFWGLLFGVLLWLTRAAGWAGFGLGIAWGYVVGVLMSGLVLPAVGMKPMWTQPGATCSSWTISRSASRSPSGRSGSRPVGSEPS